jgi:hypothetical protein
VRWTLDNAAPQEVRPAGIPSASEVGNWTGKQGEPSTTPIEVLEARVKRLEDRVEREGEI